MKCEYCDTTLTRTYTAYGSYLTCQNSRCNPDRIPEWQGILFVMFVVWPICGGLIWLLFG